LDASFEKSPEKEKKTMKESTSDQVLKRTFEKRHTRQGTQVVDEVGG
jgi:hypothetical protein